MIDYLTFIDELKKIKDNNNLIDETIKKYEGMVNEFENENAPIDHVARARENAKIEGFIE